jgi:hypothetical protein
MFKETVIYEYLKHATKLNEDFAWFYAFSEQSIKDEIIRLIQQEQLQKGIDGNDRPITNKETGTDVYSKFTEFITGGRKRAGDPYTLEDTGAFYNSMFVKIGNDYFIVDADGNKGNDDLFVKFGEDIIGLTDENIENLAQIVAQKYVEWFLQLGEFTTS